MANESSYPNALDAATFEDLKAATVAYLALLT